MPIRNLRKLFHPASVAVVGAGNRDGPRGSVIMHNLLHGGFEGPIMPVTADEQAVAGVLAYPSVDALPVTPDLAVVCSPRETIAEVVGALARRGTGAAVLMTEQPLTEAQLRQDPGHQAALATAQACGLRLLGPNGLGVMVPGIGLNATLVPAPLRSGHFAFVSQSAAISAAVLDWARDHDISFSHFVSLGDTADLDFGDVVDYLGSEPEVRTILLYIESIRDGRTFMSAGRGASRNKPILVIKAGRGPEGQRLVAVRSGAAIGGDDVYDAAIRRAGMLRVYSFGELFAAVETLARVKSLKGERLGILTNSCGIAVMATDALRLAGGHLAVLPEPVANRLEAVVPPGWPRANPVTLAGSAPPDHYADAARVLIESGSVDAVMVLHAPAAMASSTEAAAAIVRVGTATRAAVLTSWMGGERVAPARRLFAEASIPTYDTPSQAVAAFMHMVRFRRNQDMLMQMPPSKPAEFTPATDAARLLVEDCLAEGRSRIDGREANAILATYGIPTVTAGFAATPDEAVAVAGKLGFPVAIKIRSPDLPHKATAGGVDLYLDTADSVRVAAENMLVTVALNRPGARIEGFTVERMVLRPGAQEVSIGVRRDPVFGPVVTFGQGGPVAEVIGDRAVALPPLNLNLARELISRTRVSRLLDGYGDRPPANRGALCLTLVQISQMIVDLPELVDLEINPMFVDENGVLAVDASLRIAAAARPSTRDLAISPYPKDLEEEFALACGRRVLLRPIRPEDEADHYEFLSKVTSEDIRFRFFGLVRKLPHTEMARFTQIDYDREMAFIATAPRADGTQPETLGVVRTVTDLSNDTAEYAILVRSDLKGQRLGWKLLDKMIHYCRSRGTRRIVGQVLGDNTRMLDLVHRLGFTSRKLEDEDVVEVTLEL
ncbi:MAG: bifunctional acetate--CoA ligase family protein/GNAT family N-acetyltransferase [Rhodospirillales bacterium]